jgi:hypothetical protein
MTIRELSRLGWPKSRIAETLGVTEGAVRYQLRRQVEGAVDGRSLQPRLAEPWHEAIVAWFEVQDGRVNLAALHEHLVQEHAYPGSLRSLQRYYEARFPKPRRRARRRVTHHRL